MSSKIPFLTQEIRDHNLIRKQLRGRGNGLVAARDIAPRGQVLFVRQPLMLALENARLQDTCYQCLRSASDQSTSLLTSSQTIDLKACTGCHTVKFCDKVCQKLAWSRFHKYECKIYGNLHPRVLPSATRAVIRLLLQRQHDLLPAGEWDQLFTLESHQDDLSKAGSDKWQDICLMSKAIHTYSGTKESLETVLKLCCILMVNSFTLTNLIYEPLGVIFHPLPALINHSCSPNAFVRFDIPPPPPPPSANLSHVDRLPLSTISIHALEPVPKGTEITISYIDNTLPTPNRHSELSSQYFFTCTCPVCQQEPRAITDAFFPAPTTQPSISIEEAETTAIQTLSSLSSPSPTTTPSSQTPLIRHALHFLALTERWPPHRYPLPQLRRHLIPNLISTGNYSEALLHAAIKAYPIDTILHPSKHHPTRTVGLWMIYRLARLLLIEKMDDAGSSAQWQALWKQSSLQSDLKMLAALMCAMLEDVADTVLPKLEADEGSTSKTTGKGKVSKVGSANGKQASTEEPPPYIGPEAPAPGLPEYEARTGREDGDYEGSTFGQFELMVRGATIEMTDGDGQMFWRDFKMGRLPEGGDWKLWVAGRIKEMLEREKNYKGEDGKPIAIRSRS